jgi:hypothetical protein
MAKKLTYLDRKEKMKIHTKNIKIFLAKKTKDREMLKFSGFFLKFCNKSEVRNFWKELTQQKIERQIFASRVKISLNLL